MQLRETLTKEAFWNEMMEKYPKATKDFCDWIDEYKKAVSWDKLFNENYHQSNIKRAANGEICSIDFSAPKFHDLPYDMQLGIWIAYCRHNLHKFFEQAEYEPSFIDLEEDIKSVLGEVQEVLNS